MRIVLLGPVPPYRGGISHYTALLSKALSLRHKLKLISYQRQYPSWLYPGKSDKEESDSVLQTLPADFILDSMNPLTWLLCARNIARFNPDLIILQWWTAYWTPQYAYIVKYIKRYQANSQILMICHNSCDHENVFWKKWAAKYILKRVDQILTHNANESQNLVKNLGVTGEIKTGFHPTYAPLTSTKINREEARCRLKLKKDESVLLFFGFVRPYKGLNILLEALEKINRQKTVKLLVAGEFWSDKKEYENKIKKLKIESYVHICDGYIDSETMALYFKAADLVVTPYLTGTGSGVIQLAYGFDRPVISSRVGSAVDVLEDGVNGRLVPPGNSFALAQAVLDALEHEQNQVLNMNAKFIKEKFSWERLVQIIEN